VLNSSSYVLATVVVVVEVVVVIVVEVNPLPPISIGRIACDARGGGGGGRGVMAARTGGQSP
jgi:hypothetical protein